MKHHANELIQTFLGSKYADLCLNYSNCRTGQVSFAWWLACYANNFCAHHDDLTARVFARQAGRIQVEPFSAVYFSWLLSAFEHLYMQQGLFCVCQLYCGCMWNIPADVRAEQKHLEVCFVLEQVCAGCNTHYGLCQTFDKVKHNHLLYQIQFLLHKISV